MSPVTATGRPAPTRTGQGAGELLAPLLDPLPERGAAGGAAAARQRRSTTGWDARPARRFRRRLGSGGAACGSRPTALTRFEVFSWQPLGLTPSSMSKRRVPAVREASVIMRDLGLRQVRGRPAPAPRLARPHAGQSHAAESGPHVLAPMLKEEGKLIGDFTLGQASDERGLLSWPAPAWPRSTICAGSSSTCRSRRIGHALRALGLGLVRPFDRRAERFARGAVSRLTHSDVSAEAFKFMAIREMDLGMAPGRWSAASPSPAISATRSGASPTPSATCTICCARPAMRTGCACSARGP